MRLHELGLPIQRRGKKRIGRGGKRGTYSGKGQKGQRARAGHRILPAERRLISRLPKLRGTKHKPLKEKPLVANLRDLARWFPDGEINKNSFVKKGLMRTLGREIKVLSMGEARKGMVVKGLFVSKGAQTKIEAAGGKVIK